MIAPAILLMLLVSLIGSILYARQADEGQPSTLATPALKVLAFAFAFAATAGVTLVLGFLIWVIS